MKDATAIRISHGDPTRGLSWSLSSTSECFLFLLLVLLLAGVCSLSTAILFSFDDWETALRSTRTLCKILRSLCSLSMETSERDGMRSSNRDRSTQALTFNLYARPFSSVTFSRFMSHRRTHSSLGAENDAEAEPPTSAPATAVSKLTPMIAAASGSCTAGPCLPDSSFWRLWLAERVWD